MIDPASIGYYWPSLPYFDRQRYILKHYERIAVRVQIDGRWKSVFLSELPDDGPLMDEVRRLAKREVPPVMLKEDQG
jgi:hypothetical protein